MVRKFIRGHETRGAEVIKELEKLGGVNSEELHGDAFRQLYFIDEKSKICDEYDSSVLGILIQEMFYEIHLPPAFEPKEHTMTFVTAPRTKGCGGCALEGIFFCFTKLNLPDCGVEFVYKLKS